MSSTQRSQRRTSTRLLEKGDAPTSSGRAQVNGRPKASKDLSDREQAQASRSPNEKKRKVADYDEEDDGFLFTRVKKPKPQPRETSSQSDQIHPAQEALNVQQQEAVAVPISGSISQPSSKKRRHRLSFSTPDPKADSSVRRSKRLSRENQSQDASPAPKSDGNAKKKRVPVESLRQAKQSPIREKEETVITAENKTQSSPKPKVQEQEPAQKPDAQPPESSQPCPQPRSDPENIADPENDHSATRIALPFADTPVIKRNKAMREGKSGKGERRSSLGLRGRRASSLIETGTSNALPHNEVEIPDFYKHIESDGLLEPRRMRQLLTWCATRALDDKPIGTDFEDASARSAARVIEEELLKDLANRSELSDWFSREDVPMPKEPLPERPNPKNNQNNAKILELESQIKRLRTEKQELESLLRPPKVSKDTESETTLLPQADASNLHSFQANAPSLEEISGSMGRLYDTLGPTIDSFADGIHKIGQYRDAADNLAGQVLSICAQGLARRDKEERKRALGQSDSSPPQDLSGVLRSLSRAEG